MTSVRKKYASADVVPVAQSTSWARRAVRRSLGPQSLPRRVWRQVKPTDKLTIGEALVEQRVHDLLFTPPNATETRGIYLYGSCDVERLLNIARRGAPAIEQRLGISYRGPVAASRVDVLVQKLDGVESAATAEVVERLQLIPDYFKPELFEPTFSLEGFNEQPFGKDAVVLSMASSVARSLYRHKEEGFLVDPGGWWLSQSLDGAMPDRDTTKWFRQNYKSVGRLSVPEWEENFRRVIAELRARTNAQIFVLNLLTIEPHDLTHTYVGRSEPETIRRRRFHLRMVEVAQELGVHIIDTDRRLKELGIEGANDFAHMPSHHFGPVDDEVLHLLDQTGVITLNDQPFALTERHLARHTPPDNPQST